MICDISGFELWYLLSGRGLYNGTPRWLDDSGLLIVIPMLLNGVLGQMNDSRVMFTVSLGLLNVTLGF